MTFELVAAAQASSILPFAIPEVIFDAIADGAGRVIALPIDSNGAMGMRF